MRIPLPHFDKNKPEDLKMSTRNCRSPDQPTHDFCLPALISLESLLFLQEAACFTLIYLNDPDAAGKIELLTLA